MCDKPFVSVIMPVRNCKRFVANAVNSILSQTYANFEFIIINDGSTDETPQILEGYNDSRIQIIKNSKNLGISESLNLGISHSKGELIARMDADDFSLPGRLEAQVKFMQEHPEVGVLGTQISIMNFTGKIMDISNYPAKSEDILYFFPVGCPVAHPTVMVRKNILAEYPYSTTALYGEDYELWSRLIHVTKFANLEKIFLNYRVWKGQVSSAKKNLQHLNSLKISSDFLKNLGVAEPIQRKAEILYLSSIKPKISEINSTFIEIHNLEEKLLGKKISPPYNVIDRFVSCIFKVSKLMFIKNVIFSQYLKANKSRRLAFIIIFRKMTVKLRKNK
ncbi:MAG: glycosyltransferase [Fibromonadales bacterium]|nr:glycosyltransferase [Fibromonadales bacterium]